MNRKSVYKKILLIVFLIFTVSLSTAQEKSKIPGKIVMRFLGAAEKGDIEGVKKCIREGVDINYQIRMDKPARHGMDFNGWNALTFALIKSHIDVAKLLIKEGINLNAKVGKFGTNLNFALSGVVNKRKSYLPIERQPMSFVKLFVEKGADVNIPAKDGITPLMISSIAGSKELVTFFLNNGADINAKDKSGKTAFDYAKEKKKDEIVGILKSYRK